MKGKGNRSLLAKMLLWNFKAIGRKGARTYFPAVHFGGNIKKHIIHRDKGTGGILWYGECHFCFQLSKKAAAKRKIPRKQNRRLIAKLLQIARNGMLARRKHNVC